VSTPVFDPAAARAWRAARVDYQMINQRVGRARTRSIKNESKRQLLLLALSMIDLTTLEGADTPGKVEALCRKALTPMPELPGIPHTAAVCVYPKLVPVARDFLGPKREVKIAAVATGFPAGQIPLPMKLEEVRDTVALGADEIDMVIDRGAFLSGDDRRVFDEIVATKAACGSARLKVILETGELGSFDNVAAASRLAIAAGADFIKTSTGKISPAATLPVTLVMLEAIREHYLETGVMIGMKPAGGIRTAKDALHYLVLVAETLGKAWMDPTWFRFGASSLANDLLRQIARLDDGHYQSPRRFSVD
jgi:deoxyribose-phosphate aldolase